MPKIPPRKPSRLIQAPEAIPPRASRDYAPLHGYSDGKGGIWTHEGYARTCRMPECVQWHREQKKDVPPLLPPKTPPWGYSGEHVESWSSGSELDYVDGSEPPPDPRPDSLALCPETGGEHKWQYGDDGKGHSGDVCACGAFEE